MDELQRARLERLRAQIAFASQRGRDAPPLLLEAARRLDPLDAALARETYLEAFASAMFAGRLGTGPDAHAVAEAARAAHRGPAPGAAGLLLDALVTRFTEGYAASVEPLSRALRTFGEPDGGGADRRWLWLACRLAQDLWDDELWHVLATRGVRLARETGALNLLPNALNYLAVLNVHSGAFGTAAEQVAEVDSITQATGIPPLRYAKSARCWWRAAIGEQALAAARLGLAQCDREAGRGVGARPGLVSCTVLLLHNSQGHYGEALAAARRACEYEDVIAYGWALVELIEAAVRAIDARSRKYRGRRRRSAELRERTRASGTEWALGVEARCRALVSDDESRYRESVERLARSRAALELARSRLLYGEWLRRANRRVDARDQLRAAHEMFSRMGAAAFAERARRELSATGETVRKRTVETLDELTTQEAQVARLAAQGHTNPEIGAELFISPRTVEYHLHKIFPKLGISSRKELRRVLPAAEHAAMPA